MEAPKVIARRGSRLKLDELDKAMDERLKMIEPEVAREHAAHFNDQERFMKSWHAWVAEIGHQHAKTIFHNLLAGLEPKIENGVIQVTVKSQMHQKMLLEHESLMLDYFLKDLELWLQLKIDVEIEDQVVHKYLQPDEKFQILLKKNPDLKLLQDLFGFKTD